MKTTEDVIKKFDSKLNVLIPESFFLEVKLLGEFSSILNNFLSSDNYDDFQVENFNFELTYLKYVTVFLNQNPRFELFSPELKSKKLFVLSQRIIFLTICELIHPKFLNKEIGAQKRDDVYDRLALDYFEVRNKIGKKISRSNEVVFDRWCSIICCTFYEYVSTFFEYSSLRRNSVFEKKVESYIRKLILGFVSPEIQGFHSMVYSLLGDKEKSFFTKEIETLTTQITELKIEDDLNEYSMRLMIAKTMERKERNESKDLFDKNRGSELFERALELHGIVKRPKSVTESRMVSRMSARTMSRTISQESRILDPSLTSTKDSSLTSINAPKASPRSNRMSIKRAQLAEPKGVIIREKAVEKRKLEIEKNYKNQKRKIIRDICQSEVKAAEAVNKRNKDGKLILASDIGRSVLYDKMEKKAREKQIENGVDHLNGRKPQFGMEYDTDLSQLEGSVATAIIEDELF